MLLMQTVNVQLYLNKKKSAWHIGKKRNTGGSSVKKRLGGFADEKNSNNFSEINSLIKLSQLISSQRYWITEELHFKVRLVEAKNL